MNGLKRTPAQIKHRQELCGNLLDTILESSDNGDLSLLETLIDEYVYRLNEDELEELQKDLREDYGYE